MLNDCPILLNDVEIMIEFFFFTVCLKFVRGSEAKARGRTLHGSNLLQISKNNSFCSFALDSTHAKFDVWPLPELPFEGPCAVQFG